MTSDDIIAKLRKTVPALKAEGVTGLAVFGSRSRGDARADSDLDALVDIDPKAKFSPLDLVGVQHIIQDATGLELKPRCGANSIKEWPNASLTIS